MNLVADENVDQPIVDRLRQDGHLVVAVAELSPSISDDEVLRQANQQSALLITGDKDFGELVYRLGRVHAGVILLCGLTDYPATPKRTLFLTPCTNAATKWPVLSASSPRERFAFAVSESRDNPVRSR